MDNNLTTLLDILRTRINDEPKNSLALAEEVFAITVKHPDNHIIVEGYYLLGLSYWEEGKNLEAEALFKKAYELLQKDTSATLKAQVISVLAITQSIRYKKEECYSLAKEALLYENQIEDYASLISLYARVGGTYIRLAMYANALEILLKGVNLIGESAKYKDEGYIFSHLSIVQTRMKYYEEAIIHSIRAEKIFTKIGNQERGIIAILINKAMAYFFNGDTHTCIVTLERVKELCFEDYDRYEKSLCLVYMNLSGCYGNEKIKNYPEAIKNAQLSLEIAKKKKHNNVICLCLSYILKSSAGLNNDVPDFLKEKYQSNDEILHHIIEISNEINDLMINKEVFENISDYYVFTKNYEKAYQYQKELININEKISDKEKDENLFALNLKYETSQKEIQLQQLELDKKELELQQKERLKEVNKSLESKVKERTSELVAKNNELEQYAYIVAHDLKEPIRSIVGFSQLIKKRAVDELSDTTNELLEYVVNASYNMQEMVDDLLTFSTIQVEKNNYTKINISNLLEKVLLNLRNKIKENNAEIIIEDLPEYIVGDNIRIRQLFQNIISNALKFRDASRNPIIKIRGHATSNGCSFSIQDNGIGIHSEFKDKIFLLFKRLHTKDKFKGSGIGLSVCQKIVKQHGGDIWVTSNEGKGATFHFTLE